MGNKGGGDKGIKIEPAKDYEKMIKLQLQYLPRQLQAELASRAQYDPQFLDQALGLQHQYDPRLAQEQRDALARRDPQWLALHEGLGDKIKEALDRGYLDKDQEAAYRRLAGLAGKLDPEQEAAYHKLAGLAGTVDPQYRKVYAEMMGQAGKVDPRYASAYKKLFDLAGKGEPTRDKAYQALGQQVTGDTLRGGTASPETLRQMTQAIMSQRPGLSYGEAQDMATAVYTGQRSEALKSQRQGATGQFLQQATPTSQREQSLGQFSQVLDPMRMSQTSRLQGLSAMDPNRMRQQSLGAFYGMPSLTQQQQQSLGQFYGMQAPELQTLGLAGTYIQPSNSLVNAENMIGGVQAPRAFGYVNPNAGLQGVQLGLQNQQAQLANQGLSGGGSNPWMNALQGASTGASYGSIGGGYGAAGGAIVGAAAGAFGYPQYSDERLKNNISRTQATTKDGIPIVEYDYNGKRWRGVIAQEVEKVRPDAVHHYGNGTLGVFYSKLGIELQEVHDAD